MSDNNNNVFDLVILFLVFAMFGNNGFGIGGNANNAATTANMTATVTSRLRSCLFFLFIIISLSESKLNSKK